MHLSTTSEFPMRPVPLNSLRLRASKRQHHRCHYCKFPMWHKDSAAFLRAYPCVRARHVHLLACTAEHLIARQDGGRDTADNIVAACWWCNRERHRGRAHKAPDAARYEAWVLRQVVLGRWHPVAASLMRRFGQSTMGEEGVYPGPQADFPGIQRTVQAGSPIAPPRFVRARASSRARNSGVP